MKKETKKEHEHCKHNRKEIEESNYCACFYCLSYFTPAEITKWCNGGDTALCPCCGIDAVLASASEIDLTDDLLKKMYKEWFSV